MAAPAVLAVATLDPETLGWSTEPGVAQVMGMRTWLMWGLAGLGALSLLVALLLGARRRRPVRAITLGIVCVLAAGTHLLVLGSRGLDAGVVPDAASEREGDVTVVTANVRGERADAETVAAVVDLVIGTGADVVALPEGQPVLDDVVAGLDARGGAFQVFPAFGAGTNRGTALLVADGLGEYEEVEGPAGAVLVAPVDGDGFPIAAVHPTSLPLDPSADLDRWRTEVARVQALFRTMPGGIVAGDMNATPDHYPLRETGGYMDAGSTAGIGGYGTYPSSLPGLLGTSIDRVLVDRGRFSVTEGAVVDIPGSDHRAVVVRVRESG